MLSCTASTPKSPLAVRVVGSDDATVTMAARDQRNRWVLVDAAICNAPGAKMNRSFGRWVPDNATGTSLASPRRGSSEMTLHLLLTRMPN
jgi:hypothetical protein